MSNDESICRYRYYHPPLWTYYELNSHLTSEKSKIWKISFTPKFSDLDELDEIIDKTLVIFQVMIINHLTIEKSTYFILFQKFAKFQILTLNVQIPIIRYNAPLMQVRMDIIIPVFHDVFLVYLPIYLIETAPISLKLLTCLLYTSPSPRD